MSDAEESTPQYGASVINGWPLAERTRATEKRLRAHVLPAMRTMADHHGLPPGAERELLERFEEDWDECLIEQMAKERAMAAAREHLQEGQPPDSNA